MEMGVCHRCSKKTPVDGSFCMHCGKSLRPPRYMLWSGKNLKVADGADVGPLIEAIFQEDVDSSPTVEAVRWALSKLSERRRQIVIRLYNLDKGGKRSLNQVATEGSITNTAVGYNRNKALQVLLHPTLSRVLLGYKPVPEA